MYHISEENIENEVHKDSAQQIARQIVKFSQLKRGAKWC
jgi:hypothetical protein